MAHHLAAAEPRDGRAGTQGSPRWRPPPPERRRRFRTLVVLIPEAARLAADLSVVRARRPEIRAVAYSAARRRDGCGRGRLPPSGVTVTTDRHIWDKARARWLARHGYPTTGDLVASS